MNYSTLEVVVMVGEAQARVLLVDDAREWAVLERTQNPDFDFPAPEFGEVRSGTSWWCPVLGCAVFGLALFAVGKVVGYAQGF